MSRKNDQQQTGQVKRPAKLTTCMITQSTLLKYWRFTEAELEALDRGESIASIVLKRFRVAGLTVLEMYAIIHDNDQRKMWDEYRVDFRYFPAHEHIHILVKFKDGATLETIAEIVGIAPEYVEEPKTGRYSYDGMLAYLCHAKYPRKYAYNPRSVVTLVGGSYLNYYTMNMERWLRTRYQRILRDASVVLNEIRIRIIEDGLDLRGIIMNDEYKQAYYFNRAKIDGWLQDKKQIDNLERGYRQPERG